MNLKFNQLVSRILNEGIGDPEAAESSAREYNKSLSARNHTDAPVNDRALRSRERNAGLEDEDKNQPYKIRVTWKSGGKSFLKAGGTEVVYRGTSGYYKAEMKAKSLKANPKIEKADVLAV